MFTAAVIKKVSALAERIATDVRNLPGVTDTLTTIGGGQLVQPHDRPGGDHSSPGFSFSHTWKL